MQFQDKLCSTNQATETRNDDARPRGHQTSVSAKSLTRFRIYKECACVCGEDERERERGGESTHSADLHKVRVTPVSKFQPLCNIHFFTIISVEMNSRLFLVSNNHTCIHTYTHTYIGEPRLY